MIIFNFVFFNNNFCFIMKKNYNSIFFYIINIKNNKIYMKKNLIYMIKIFDSFKF